MFEGLIGAAAVVVALAALPLLIVVLYRSNKRLDFITPTYLFASVYVIMLLIGSFIDALRGGSVFFPAALGFGGFVAGVAWVNQVGDVHPRRELWQFLNKPWQWRWDSLSGRAALAAGAAVTGLFTLLYFVNYGIPLLANSPEAARLASTSGANYYIYAITVPLPFFVTLAWLYGRTKGTRDKLAIGAAVVLLSMAITTATAYRALVGHVLILVIISDQFHTKRINLRWVAGAVVFFAGLFVVASAARFGGASGVSRAFTALWDRIVMVNVGNVSWIMSFIPAEHGYLFGRSYLMDIGAMLPGPDKAFTGWLTSIRKPGLADAPVGMTPTIIGESYANFGLLGVFAIPFLFGSILQASWIAVLRRPKYIDVLALYLVCVLFAAKLALRGIGGIVATRGIPLLLMAVGLELAHQFRPLERLSAMRSSTGASKQ